MKLFIGCASSDEIPDNYKNDCNEVINRLLKNNDLVFGAYDKGLMGKCLEVAKSNHNKVTGIANKMYEQELNKLGCDKTIVTDTIIDRTKALLEECDAIVFLPGGIGTINEIFAAIDSKRSGELFKKIVIYNPYNYYGYLLQFLDRLYEEKFTSDTVKDCYYVAYSLYDLVNYLGI